ncbi:MAG: T9SS type A sorting domain-containing protein [Bacteroidota bacterium]
MKKTLLIFAFAATGAVHSRATVFTVNSLANTNTGTGTSGTLYYCISQANMATGPHTINFSVAGTISVNAALPTLIQAITIDATTAPGYTNTPVVMLDGSTLLNGNGLVITSPDCRIYGLDINSFPYRGIHVNGDAADNFEIGALGKGNVVRNSGYYGIQITGADNGKIVDNKIGTDPAGMSCAANLYDGIDLNTGANNDSILHNQISCNGYNGIQIGGSNNNVVQGNMVGPLIGNCTGSGYRGIDIEGGSTGNKIGGSNFSEWNKIAGNIYWGIEVKGTGTINNLISGNSYSCNAYDAIDVNTGGNNNIAPPVISSANATTISGTALPNAVIEVFKAQNTNPTLCPTLPANQGTDYLGSVTADGAGNWTMSGSFSGCVTATQRDAGNNSSAFSASVSTGVGGTLTNSCSGNVIITLVHAHPESRLFSLYPNPSSGMLHVETAEKIELLLLNALGEELQRWELNPGKNQLDLSSVDAGMYFLQSGGSMQQIIITR